MPPAQALEILVVDQVGDGAHQVGLALDQPFDLAAAHIARALAAKPKLLLLDEPAAGLSADESKRLSAAIRDIARRGTTVLLIEHDMKLVMNTADTIAVMDFGRKIAEGTPAAIRENPAVITAYLGVDRA